MVTTSMEPPTKRLRILQSVEVDENDPEYVRQKQVAQTVLKNQFENIFAKYEHMPASRSDEIDMLTGKLVVDRGHLRSLENDKRGWQSAQFLDDLMADNLDGYDEDSSDELAPLEASQSSQPEASTSHQQDDNQLAIPSTRQAQFASTRSCDQSHLRNALSPTVEPVQLQQPVFTPQLDQNTLLMGLGQVFLNAVSQMFPQALPNDVAPIQTNAPRTFQTPSSAATTSTGQITAPGSDPKWYFPPLPEPSNLSTSSQSSPLPGMAPAQRMSDVHTPLARQVLPLSMQIASPWIHGSPNPRKDNGDLAPGIDYLAVETQETTHTTYSSINRKYVFTEEDDGYIINQKEVHKKKWADIIASQEKWKDWPWYSVQQHYTRHLRDRNKEPVAAPQFDEASTSKPLQRAEFEPQRETDNDEILDMVNTVPSATPTQRSRRKQNVNRSSSPTQRCHLPTPRSLEHAKRRNSHNDASELTTVPRETTQAFLMFSDEDLELLSLASDGNPEDDGAEEVEDIAEPEDAQDDGIYPSVESCGLSEDEYDLSQPAVLPRLEPQQQPPLKSEPTPIEEIPRSSPISARKRRKAPPTQFAVDSDSEEASFAPTSHSPPKSRGIPANSAKDFHSEPNLPTTPKIKQEFLTPGPSSFLAATPKSAPQLGPPSSSPSKDTSKLSKPQYARQIRAQWAKQARSRTPQTLKHKRSLPALKKRKWQEDSEDELAL